MDGTPAATGVPGARADPEAACRFYGELFGWTFDQGVAALEAQCADPAGAPFRLWQLGARPAAQVVNVAGAWNFSHLLTGRPDLGTGPLGFVMNVVWVVLAGWWLALHHIVLAIGLFVSLIGIPFGLQHLKLALISFAPIGQEVVEG